MMSNEGASSTRFRLSLDFSKWGRMQRPRGGTFNSNSSNNLVFSGSKMQLQAGFFSRDLSLRTYFKDNFNWRVVNDVHVLLCIIAQTLSRRCAESTQCNSQALMVDWTQLFQN